LMSSNNHCWVALPWYYDDDARLVARMIEEFGIGAVLIYSALLNSILDNCKKPSGRSRSIIWCVRSVLEEVKNSKFVFYIWGCESLDQRLDFTLKQGFLWKFIFRSRLWHNPSKFLKVYDVHEYSAILHRCKKYGRNSKKTRNTFLNRHPSPSVTHFLSPVAKLTKYFWSSTCSLITVGAESPFTHAERTSIGNMVSYIVLKSKELMLRR
jgi:hypothetical protein